jgi:OFA family oxalate/formate antiporter-like MFS transporter
MGNFKASNNFGSKGWGIIIFCMFMYFNFAAWTADGVNIFTTGFSQKYDLNQAVLLSWSTPANWVGVIGALVFTTIVAKKGSRLVASLCLIGQGIVAIWFGFASSTIMYGIALSLLNFFAAGFGFVVPGTLLNVWFPRKKGLAIGWATMGMGVCTATFVAAVSWGFAHLGISTTMGILGVGLIILGILSIFWVKDNPEIAGAFPDNDPSSLEDLEKTAALIKAYQSPFTVKRMLKDKDMWLISLGFGLIWLGNIGIVSQYVVRLTQTGHSQTFALAMLSSAAIFSLPGSYLWGWLEQKIGVKKATVIYIICYIAVLLLMLVKGGVVVTFLTSIAVGMGIAGVKNYVTSMTGTVYGRYDFAAANRVITPIANTFRALPFAIMGYSLSRTGGFDAAYIFFIVLFAIALVLISRVNTTCKGAVSLEELNDKNTVA